MSKQFRIILLFLLAFLHILHSFNNSLAQDLDVSIKVNSLSPASVTVQGKFKSRIPPAKNLSILSEFAGIQDLAARVSGISLEDLRGSVVAYKQFIPSEFVAEREFAGWNYSMALAPLKNRSSAAHTSWVTGSEGILFLHDLLPRIPEKYGKVSARIRLELPAGWMVAGENPGTTNYDIPDIGRAVFFIGTNQRERNVKVGKFGISIAISGAWNFTDDEVEQFVREIYSQHREVFGSDPIANAQIDLLRFPQSVTPGNWEADTRGSTVTIVSSDMPFKTQSLQRLHEQLRHEIFHLWLPNGVNLSGNYDWFYEGFALYQSLKMGVALNRLRFEDFLDTLSRAHSIDSLQSQRTSLLAASTGRWQGANTQVYARGMVVAFLVDVAMLKRSKGKRSVSDIIREVYESHRPPDPEEDGSGAVLKLLRSRTELAGIVDRYIEGKEAVVWQADLRAAGIESTEQNSNTTLRVTAKLSGSQRDLLEKLGYNNWRSLRVTQK